jgi:hypothetical protein
VWKLGLTWFREPQREAVVVGALVKRTRKKIRMIHPRMIREIQKVLMKKVGSHHLQKVQNLIA